MRRLIAEQHLPYVRRVVVEPVVIAMALVGLAAIYLLPGVKPEHIDTFAKACRMAALQAALAISFHRAVLAPALRHLSRAIREEEGSGNDHESD